MPHTRPGPSTAAMLMQWGEIRPCSHELCCRAFPHGRGEARLLAMQGRKQEELGEQHAACVSWCDGCPSPWDRPWCFWGGALHGDQVQCCPLHHPHPHQGLLQPPVLNSPEGRILPLVFLVEKGTSCMGLQNRWWPLAAAVWSPKVLLLSCPGVPEPGWAPFSEIQRSSCVFWVINS